MNLLNIIYVIARSVRPWHRPPGQVCDEAISWQWERLLRQRRRVARSDILQEHPNEPI